MLGLATNTLNVRNNNNNNNMLAAGIMPNLALFGIARARVCYLHIYLLYLLLGFL